MGKTKYLKEIEEFFRKTPVVATRDIKVFVKNTGYSYLLVHNLVKTGRIKRVTKGFYSIYDDPVVAVFCFKPAYIGLQDALSFHNLWEQETATIIVTGKRIRTGIRRIFGVNVVVRRIKPIYIFGFDTIRYGEFFIPVSDIEKTLIDFIYFNEPIREDVLRELRRRLDQRKLAEYLKAYPDRVRRRVWRAAGRE
ncbi:hypothetical protein B6U74_03875 [Candidatus Bathyarchaeota archaeon ex4484_205]|nr:MAG: hypothetical protein B6U74_03875 [Candidatus Bathyarchaeota archaeon ex4484_205]